MAVYDASGNELTAVYDAIGNELDYAYDASGNVIYSKGTTPTNTIRVMSFNVGCFYTEYFPCPNDKGKIFYQRNRTIFNNSKPDVCGMPEWYKYIGAIEADTLMNEFWTSYVPNYEAYNGTSKPNNAITFASTYQITDQSIVRYATQNGEVRYYQKGYITVDGKRICIANTHLALNSARQNQFTEFLDMLEQEEYFIATGDFNFEINAIGDSEYNLSVQEALARGFNSAQNGDGIFMTWYSAKTVAESTRINALDNIITSSNIDISNVHVDTTKLTDGLCEANNIIIDHLPLVCDCTIN